MLRSLSVIGLVLSSTLSFASDENVNIIKADQPVVIEDSSEFNRIGKSMSFYLESAGGTYAGVGLGAAYIFDRKNQLLIDTYSYSMNLSQSIVGSVIGMNENLSGFSVGAHFKHYFGNSFFLRTGADFRQMSYNNNWTGFGYNDYEAISGHAIDGVIGIGNDWQWSHFTLGFDWLRLAFPASSTVDSSKATGLYQTSSDLKYLKDQYVSNASLMIGLHLGATF